MRKNKLYTVNKWNQPAFVDREHHNIFDGFDLSTMARNYFDGSSAKRTFDMNLGTSMEQQYLQSKNALGISKAANPFSKVNMAGVGKAMGNAALGIGANLVGGIAGDALSGGLESGAGSAISNIGGQLGSAIGAVNPVAGAIVGAGSQIIGGLTNRMFGSKLNEEKIAEVQQQNANLNQAANAFAGADGKEGLLNNWGDINTNYSFRQSDIGEDGWFADDAEKKYEELKKEAELAKRNALSGFRTGLHNVETDERNKIEDNFIYAFGGKKYDDGGLTSSFLNTFGSDPIAAAVRYSRGLEQLEAEREAREAEAAREVEYNSMRQRLANLESQNQGLSALVATTPKPPYELPIVSNGAPASFTPSRATYNSNWDYIEDQLKKSGKFNDTQIKGIKYNLQRESGIGEYDGGDNGTARGLAQWRGSRIPKDMSLEGQTKYLIDTLSKYDGKEHWIGKDNYMGFMNARTPEEAHYYIAKGYERPAKEILRKVRRDSDMSLKKLNASGGMIDTAPADNTRVAKLAVNTERPSNWLGYKHPYGNYDDVNYFLGDTYISENGTAPNDGRRYITRKQADEIQKMIDDKKFEGSISKALNRMLLDNNRGIKAFGGELGTNGTDWTNGLLEVNEGGTHESNPFEGVPMGIDVEGIPNLVEEGETVYNDYVFSDRMSVPKFMLKDLGLPKSNKKISFADASKKLSQESEQRPNDPISQAGLQAALSRLAEIQETERMKNQAKEYGLEKYADGGILGNKYSGPGSKPQKMRTKQVPKGRSSNFPVIKETVPSEFGLPQNNYESDYPWLFGDIPETPQLSPMEQIARDKSTPERTIAVTDNGTNFNATYNALPETRGLAGIVESGSGVPTYATWMRYAPAVGSGIMALTDALGLTNKPDYTYADKLEAAASRAGYAPNINYKPVGDYLTYRPMDIWYQQNALNAQSRATDRALMNSSAPSRAAGLLANGYNSQLASGNLYRQALEYNDAKRKDVADFNRRTNMFNSQMDLEAAMANARYQQAARQMGLSGLAQAAAMRNDIDARIGASRSANLSNFLNNLGNIGRENFAMNQINTDRSRRYYGNLSGSVGGYKAACGGKMKRK